MTQPRIAVCIATTGRPVVLVETLRNVAAQTRPPDRVLVCPAKPDDVDLKALAALPLSVGIVHGAKAGSSPQRNVLLDAVPDADLVLFLDDDFLLAPTYLAALQTLFETRPECVVATGLVLADGATNQGYSVAEGRAILADAADASDTIHDVFNGYGCNMAVRWSKLRDHGCRFDENLPLYAWAEDVDFSRQAARFGRIVKADSLVGVHLAEKRGRVSGRRFGYSQIANPVYLIRKGTVTFAGGLRKMAENIAANALGALRNNETYVDRRGRLRGNLEAILDVIVGRSSPGRILDL